MPEEPSGGRAAASARASRRALQRFTTWFWRPPRPHGDTIVDRRVSPLELLYDLAYAAAISQAGNPLTAQVSANVVEFAIIFSLIWIAWINGSLYLELHGSAGGRTRTYVFIQIAILAILAVYASDAGGGGGAPFAIVYAAFLAVMAWLWYEVRRRDVAERPEFVADTSRYLVLMAVSAVLILVSAFLPAAPRLVVWAAFTAAWMIALFLFGRSPVGLRQGMTPTDSLVDRFGTFTMIVLGAVVFDVVEGMSQSQHDVKTIATGMVALVVGFGFWWIYFDVAGGRLPRREGRALASWILGHHPITLAIAAAGAGMVSLVEHAHDASTPAPTSWLLAGAVAVGMLAVILVSRALEDAARLARTYRPLWVALAAGAMVSVLIGWARPAPWLLALLLVLVLALVWAVAARGFVLSGEWSADRSVG